MSAVIETLRGVVPSELFDTINAAVNPISFQDNSNGTGGANTSHTASGRCEIANGASSVVVTNNKCAATDIVMAVLEESDAAYIIRIVPANGSFTVTLNTTTSGVRTMSWYIAGKR